MAAPHDVVDKHGTMLEVDNKPVGSERSAKQSDCAP
jgi:hypothetical protein